MDVEPSGEREIKDGGGEDDCDGRVAGRNGIADAAGIHPSPPSPLIPLTPKWPAKWPELSLPSPLFCPTNCPASSHSRTSTPVESAELALGDVGNNVRGRGSEKTGGAWGFISQPRPETRAVIVPASLVSVSLQFGRRINLALALLPPAAETPGDAEWVSVSGGGDVLMRGFSATPGQDLGSAFHRDPPKACLTDPCVHERTQPLCKGESKHSPSSVLHQISD
jgi:hypothetical protein